MTQYVDLTKNNLYKPFCFKNCMTFHCLNFFVNSWPSAPNFKSFSQSIEQFYLTAVFLLKSVHDISRYFTSWLHKCIQSRLKTLVFFFQNLSELLWDKSALAIEKNFWNSVLKAKNLQFFWDHYNNAFEKLFLKQSMFLTCY